VDDGPLDRMHQLVPPLEVTATAGVCVGLFAIGRMIFRAPIALTILGCVAFVGFAGIQQGLGLGQLWHLSLLVAMIIAIIFMVGLFLTGHASPAFGLLLLVVFTLNQRYGQHDVSAPSISMASGGDWGWFWLIILGILAAVIAVVVYACVCDRKERNSPLF
jgi:hypothetical protein